MTKYLCCGNIMSDLVIDAKGNRSDPHIGGPAFYALAGVRLWTEDCRLVCHAGADYKELYGGWMRDNHLTSDSVRISAEHCTQHILQYGAPDGTFTWSSRYGDQNLGYLKTKPEEIETAITADTVGFYLAQNTDRIFFEKIAKIKEKHNVKMMWELEYPHEEDGLRRVREVISIADMWSLNLTEASLLFGIPREKEEDIIAEIMKMPVEMTLFRVGSRGAYCVTPTQAIFCPSIDIEESMDPTGCGNCSTGAAMYAHLEGFSPAEVVATANIAAGYNVAQYGPYPIFSEEVMRQAHELRVQKTKKDNKKDEDLQ